jgi:hypothetical protein
MGFDVQPPPFVNMIVAISFVRDGTGGSRRQEQLENLLLAAIWRMRALNLD